MNGRLQNTSDTKRRRVSACRQHRKENEEQTGRCKRCVPPKKHRCWQVGDIERSTSDRLDFLLSRLCKRMDLAVRFPFLAAANPAFALRTRFQKILPATILQDVCGGVDLTHLCDVCMYIREIKRARKARVRETLAVYTSNSSLTGCEVTFEVPTKRGRHGFDEVASGRETCRGVDTRNRSQNYKCRTSVRSCCLIS